MSSDLISDLRLMLDQSLSQSADHLTHHVERVCALIWHLLGFLNKLDKALQRHLLRVWVLDLADELLDFADLGVPRPALVGEGLSRLALSQE